MAKDASVGGAACRCRSADWRAAAAFCGPSRPSTTMLREQWPVV